MATNLTTIDEGNGFVLRRSVGSGFVSDIDPVAKGFLDDLNKKLSKPIFKPDPVVQVEAAEDDAIGKCAIKQNKADQTKILDTHASARARKVPLDTEFEQAGLDKKLLATIKALLIEARKDAVRRRAGVTPDIVALLGKDLDAAKTPDTTATPDERWKKGSLAWTFANEPEADNQLTLSDYIISHEELSALKFKFDKRLAQMWGSLDDNVKLVLHDRDAIKDYLIAAAFFAQDTELTDVDRLEAEKDFDVDLFDDTDPQQEISEAAVKCAAQLFYGMVLGDELDIFNVVNFFTHKYLVRGAIEIQDRRLRDDLQMYVFSGKFTDLKTGKIVDRTRPAERQMFYSQVFNYGSAPGSDDMIIRNDEYQRLWKVLMLESARYLERAQLSPNANTFVSKTNVMQAVEDLQYNLSIHCVGMATVISPLIHAELDFVIRRILMRDEVRRQVAPAGGSWWRVVENLYMAMKNTRPKATILYNKAKLGNSIIRKVAEYSSASFDTNAIFSSFISDVDAFITTQSILQEALTDDLKKGDDDLAAPAPMNGSGAVSSNGSAPSSSAGDARDDWDF
jgi:hypothetical protein